MTFIRASLLLAVFITAMLAGYQAGAYFDPTNDIFNKQMDTMIMPGVAIPDNDQFNILIIGVDNLENQDADLESIWLAAYVEHSSKITLIPVFPSPDNPALNHALTRSFKLDGDKPGKDFWDVMRKTNLWWKGYLISDIAASIRLIDAIGGVNISGQELNGLQAIRNITPWENEALVAVNHQQMLLESIQ